MEAVEIESHDRHPRTSLTEQNIATVRGQVRLGFIENDRCTKLREIAFKVGISYESVRTIIVDELGF